MASVAGEALYVQSVSGLHSGTNPVSGDFSVGAEGLMVRGGELAEPVREVTIASTLQRMLLDIVEIGGDLTWLPGGAAGHDPARRRALAWAGEGHGLLGTTRSVTPTAPARPPGSRRVGGEHPVHSCGDERRLDHRRRCRGLPESSVTCTSTARRRGASPSVTSTLNARVPGAPPVEPGTAPRWRFAARRTRRTAGTPPRPTTGASRGAPRGGCDRWTRRVGDRGVARGADGEPTSGDHHVDLGTEPRRGGAARRGRRRRPRR